MNGAENGQENTADAGPPHRPLNPHHRPLNPPHRPLNPRLCLGSRRHYTWDVPHDVDGFIALWPSVDAFVEKLQFNMEESTKVGLVRGDVAHLAMFAELTTERERVMYACSKGRSSTTTGCRTRTTGKVSAVTLRRRAAFRKANPPGWCCWPRFVVRRQRTRSPLPVAVRQGASNYAGQEVPFLAPPVLCVPAPCHLANEVALRLLLFCRLAART